MATTDINGMVFYTTSDLVTPLASNINAISTAVTNAFNSETRTFRVANQAARDALLTARGASASAPLQVDRADTGVIERNTTGVIGGWKATSNLWTSYAASLSGFNVGTGTASTIWRYDGDLVRVRYAFTFGVSGTVPTNPRFSLPVASVALAHPYPLTCGFGDLWRASGASTYPGTPVLFNTTTVEIIYGTIPGAAVAPTVPFTWTVSDSMSGELSYRPA